MPKRITITLDDNLLNLVEDWRGKQRPIPSQQDALTTMIKAGIIAFQREAQK
jgi:hypothetical protein